MSKRYHADNMTSPNKLREMLIECGFPAETIAVYTDAEIWELWLECNAQEAPAQKN